MPEFRRELVQLLPRLRRFASVLTRSHDDAEDVVQAAVERALRHADSWQQGTRLDSWLYRIMQNLWRDELRAHRRRAESLDSHADLAGADGRDVTIRHIQSNEARQALDELPEDQRGRDRAGRARRHVVSANGGHPGSARGHGDEPPGAGAGQKLAASLGEGPQRVRAAK